MSRLLARARFGPLLRLAPLVAFAAIACTSVPTGNETIVAQGPDPEAFSASVGPVYGVFERRCGSIDCHGNETRAMRIYGTNGIRLTKTGGTVPGSGAATPEEVAATYDSIIGVEPEQIDQVVQSGADPFSLLILKKPLQIESHKGGAVIYKGDDSETCILTWLQGKTNASACTTGALPP